MKIETVQLKVIEEAVSRSRPYVPTRTKLSQDHVPRYISTRTKLVADLAYSVPTSVESYKALQAYKAGLHIKPCRNPEKDHQQRIKIEPYKSINTVA